MIVWTGIRYPKIERPYSFITNNTENVSTKNVYSAECLVACRVRIHNGMCMNEKLKGAYHRRLGLGSSSRVSLPFLNPSVHFSAIDKAGESSPNVATMSTWMHIFCRKLLIPRCQILSIFKRCHYQLFSKPFLNNHISIYLERNGAANNNKNWN